MDCHHRLSRWKHRMHRHPTKNINPTPSSDHSAGSGNSSNVKGTVDRGAAAGSNTPTPSSDPSAGSETSTSVKVTLDRGVPAGSKTQPTVRLLSRPLTVPQHQIFVRPFRCYRFAAP